MFAFIKNDRGRKRPGVAGHSFRKIAEKEMTIEYRVPWKESGDRLQHGLNTPDSVNMVVLVVQDFLQKHADHCVLAVETH